MAYLETSLLAWSLGAIQIVGLASAWLARLSEGSPRQAACQRLFVACLALMGLLTMGLLFLGARHWLFVGATLSAMVLAAVWDFKDPAHVERL